MAYDVLAWAVAAGAVFGGVLAFIYYWFRRKDPRSVAHTWKVFVSLAVLIAVRYYYLHAPG